MKRIKWMVSGGALLLLITMGVIFIWGWQLFGYALCTDPDNIRFSRVVVNSSQVIISGEYTATGGYYQGYIYRLEDTTLVIGVRYLKHIPVSNTSDFTINLEIADKVERIRFMNGENQRDIYPSD